MPAKIRESSLGLLFQAFNPFCQVLLAAAMVVILQFLLCGRVVVFARAAEEGIAASAKDASRAMLDRVLFVEIIDEEIRWEVLVAA